MKWNIEKKVFFGFTGASFLLALSGLVFGDHMYVASTILFLAGLFLLMLLKDVDRRLKKSDAESNN